MTVIKLHSVDYIIYGRLWFVVCFELEKKTTSLIVSALSEVCVLSLLFTNIIGKWKVQFSINVLTAIE